MEKFVKKRTTAILLLSPAFFLFGLAAFWVYLGHPFLKNWIAEQIPKINASQPYVDLSVENIEISILKLQGRAEKIEIKFKKNSPVKIDQLKSVSIDSIKAQVDLFSLVVGQFSFSNIFIDHLNSVQNLSDLLKLKPDGSQKNGEIDLKEMFLILDEIPVQKMTFLNTDVEINVEEIQHATLRKIQFKIQNLAIAQNRKTISIQSQGLNAVLVNQQKTIATLSASIKAQLNENSYAIDKLEVKHGSSEIQIASKSQKLKQLLLEPVTVSNFKLNLRLDEMKDLVYILKHQSKRLPQISGLIRMNGQFSTSGLKKNRGSVQVSSEEVRFENLKFGNAKAQAQITDSRFLFDSILVEHPSGRAELKNISIQQAKPFNFKADLQAQDFHLQKLFESLNLKNIPADLKASATAQCSGEIENFKMHCDSMIQAHQISVQTDLNSRFHIVQIEKASAKGDFNLDLNSVQFKSQLQIGTSTVESVGRVDFQTGFEMKFNSKSLNLFEIDNIANLGLKGVVSGELTTNGDSSQGIVDSKLSINNLMIDKFNLGNVQADLKYSKSKLSFLNSSAQLNKSNYTGNIILDFSKSEIDGQMQMKPLYIEDVLFAIEERWHLPITATGKGSGLIQFSGPLDFWKMKYNLQSDFSNGHILNESFQKLNADISSDGEKINFKNVVFNKPHGTVRIFNDIITGPSQKTPKFNLQIKSNNLRAEEINHLSDLFPTANGVIHINGTVTSDILNPLIQLQTQTKDLKIDQFVLPTSQGEAQLNLDNFKFQGQIFGRQLQIDLNVPLKNTEKFSIKAQIRDFNPLTLLPMISLPLPPSDTYAAISGDIDLKSDSALIKKLSGHIQLERILLQRSTQQLKLINPATVVFNRGLQKMDPIELAGSDQNLVISLKNGSKSDLKIDGRFFLRPLQFLVPFLENLSGLAEINCFIDLNSPNLNLSGEGLIDSASVAMKGFKYPINDISAYFDFSKSKILFSEINATLNQTAITGQGQVDIKGAKNIDVSLAAETDKLDIEFPDKYQTSGNAQIKFFGNWLPYKLKIDYLINEGSITKEFTDEDTDAILSLRPSPFLPTKQLNQKNQSLILDVNADFSKGVFVKNRIIEGIAIGKINVSGSPENPILQGRIDIQQGSRLVFKDKLFDIQLGHVIFNGDYVINPNIFMTANARVSDYDINLLIQGTGKNLDIKPTSQPNLSREDIISLLALGYTSSKNDQALSSDVQQKQTGLEVLAALSNQSQLNKKLQEKLGLNVQLAPSIDSTRNIAVPKVIVSKKVSSKITTSYSRPLTGDQQENEIRLQYLWAKNLSLILNYQNQGVDQQTNILQGNKTETGVGGIDFEFKKEFGE